MHEIRFEGYSEEEILAIPKEQIEALVFTGQPCVFRIGSATLLGSLRLGGNSLTLELAQIEDGGEGVLPALASLARRFARLHGVERVEWIVHAVNCAKPNLKLRRVLDRRGFTLKNVKDAGQAYYLVDTIA